MKANTVDIISLREKLINFLETKKKFLLEILRLTKHTKFKDTEEDAQIFINLVEKRENIMSEIKKIDFETSSAKYKTVYDNHKEEIESINSEIKNLIREILEHDKSVSEKADTAFLEIKKRVKEYHDGRNLNTAYYPGGSGLDLGNYYEC